jgi:amidase
VADHDIDALLDHHDAVGLASLVADGEVSPRQLAEASIARIEERNGALNAVIADRFDAALAEADAGPTGALAGVPFLVKDLGCDVAGLPSTRGSRLWADKVATEDCELARRFKAAGLLILGNTNTPEMGKNASTEPLLHGPTRNPWRTTHSVGGSSGGSAAAVSGGIVPAAHANDGGGSIRIPASSCGLFGLKPSRGRTPAWPGPGVAAYPMAVGHAVTRTVRDSAALLDVVAGPVSGEPYASPATPPEGSFVAALATQPETLRIAYATTSVNGNEGHAASLAAMERTVEVLLEMGHRVEEASPSYEPAAVTTAMSTVMGAVSAVAIEDRLAELGRDIRDDDLEALTRVVHDGLSAAPATTLARAQLAMEKICHDLGLFHETYDLWLTPTIIEPVPELGYLNAMDLESMFTRAGRFTDFTSVFNVTGQPAMSVPSGLDGNGLPFGLQFAGRMGSEATLLRLGLALEEALPWPLLAPWPPSVAQ